MMIVTLNCLVRTIKVLRWAKFAVFTPCYTEVNRHICSDPLFSTREAQMQFEKEKKKL